MRAFDEADLRNGGTMVDLGRHTTDIMTSMAQAAPPPIKTRLGATTAAGAEILRGTPRTMTRTGPFLAPPTKTTRARCGFARPAAEPNVRKPPCNFPSLMDETSHSGPCHVVSVTTPVSTEQSNSN
jgi:hypothetical protein